MKLLFAVPTVAFLAMSEGLHLKPGKTTIEHMTAVFHECAGTPLVGSSATHQYCFYLFAGYDKFAGTSTDSSSTEDDSTDDSSEDDSSDEDIADESSTSDPSCTDELGCRYHGDCVDSKCQCKGPWTGPTCGKKLEQWKRDAGHMVNVFENCNATSELLMDCEEGPEGKGKAGKGAKKAKAQGKGNGEGKGKKGGKGKGKGKKGGKGKGKGKGKKGGKGKGKGKGKGSSLSTDAGSEEVETEEAETEEAEAEQCLTPCGKLMKAHKQWQSRKDDATVLKLSKKDQRNSRHLHPGWSARQMSKVFKHCSSSPYALCANLTEAYDAFQEAADAAELPDDSDDDAGSEESD